MTAHEQDQYHELWARLGALALGDHPPGCEEIVEEVRLLLRDHAVQRCKGNVTRAAEHLGRTSRTKVRRARGWILRDTPMRQRINAEQLVTWRSASVHPGPDGRAWIAVPAEALGLVAAGPLRVTVQAVGA